MVTTPLSSPTQSQPNHLHSFESTSLSVSSRPGSSRAVRPGHRYRSLPYSPSTSATRRDDEPSHNPRGLVSLSNSFRKSEKSSNSASPSKYSNTWLGRNQQDEQVNLPRRAYFWSPSQLALYLAAELCADDGTPLDSDTIRDMTQFVQDYKISGRVFLSLDQEDFQEIDDLHPFWRNAMWDAAWTLRKRTLPYKRSRVSNTIIKREKIRSIADVFEKSASDTSKDDPSTRHSVFQQPSCSSGNKAELQGEKSKIRILPPSFADEFIDADFSSSAVSKTDFTPRNLEITSSSSSKTPSDLLQASQSRVPFQDPELVPVLPLLPATPTDVVLNEVPDIPCTTNIHHQRSILPQSGSPFPVFREPEDVPDEDSVTPHRTFRELDIVCIPSPGVSNELSKAELHIDADGELLTSFETILTETGHAEERSSFHESTGRPPTASRPIENKDRAPKSNYITSESANQDVFTPLGQNEPRDNLTEPALIKPQTDSEKEIFPIIDVLRARVVELESRLDIMEKASFARETTHPYVGSLDKKQQGHRERSITSFIRPTDRETEHFIDHPRSTKIRALTDIRFRNATDLKVARSWQSALILLAGATTGMSVVVLSGLLRHLWNKS